MEYRQEVVDKIAKEEGVKSVTLEVKYFDKRWHKYKITNPKRREIDGTN